MDSEKLLRHIKTCSGGEEAGEDVAVVGSGGSQAYLARRHAARTTDRDETSEDLHEEVRRLRRRVGRLERALGERPPAGGAQVAAGDHPSLTTCDSCGIVLHRFGPDGSRDCPKCRHGVLRTL
ncbi:hypothetical protein [Halomarina ordinaria]|uniref:Uncharacterized protein n=1 Tax=Halomarina ordinaria TaxID=3033939 RepID=A0ABD5UB73_9EURY|nr:hypothetical protein [Halomarina sp. PSRA2]